MICEACKSEGKTSRVFAGMSYTTAAYYPPFYDEEGRYHSHDGNTTSTTYECSNGHRFYIAGQPSCWCGWPAQKKDNQ